MPAVAPPPPVCYPENRLELSQGDEGRLLSKARLETIAHWNDRTPVTADIEFAQDDLIDVEEIPYVAPELDVKFTLLVSVEDLGRLPPLPYPIEED